MTITIEIPDNEWNEIEQQWEYWSDQSYALHTAYYFREALINAGYMEGDTITPKEE